MYIITLDQNHKCVCMPYMTLHLKMPARKHRVCTVCVCVRACVCVCVCVVLANFRNGTLIGMATTLYNNIHGVYKVFLAGV